jgi:transcriptional regulator with PAS, ATPase and Fis domain
VLILGESGTGKELIARALHQHSPRARRSFVAVDCGVLTETLLRVGGKEWITVDARVVAATNQNLTELVGKRAFRRDLYYRLHVITILLPPLRERAEDIPALAHGFLRRYSQEHGKDVTAIADEAMALLHSYSWPGNIRELENTIERAVALARQPILMPEDLPANVQEGVAPEWSHDLSQEEHSFFASSPTLDDVEKRYVEYVLSRTQGNVSHAAKILDIDRRSLYRMLERFKIAPFHKGA